MPDALIVLLLTFTTRLQSLALGLSLLDLRCLCSGTMIFEERPSVQKAVEGLTTLERLDYGSPAVGRYGIRLRHDYLSNDLQTLCNLPCISWARVHVWKTTILSLNFPQTGLPYLKTLHLTVCFADLAKLASLLDATSNLE